MTTESIQPHDKAGRYLRLARSYANRFSRDQSTKVGCYLVSSDEQTELARGYNGFPRQCLDTIPSRHERPAKYDFTEHAERNAVYNAVRPELERSICLMTDVPSPSDVRAVISVAASELYFPDPELLPGSAAELEPKRFAHSLALLREANVRVGLVRHGKFDVNPGRPDAARHQRKLEQNLADAVEFAAVMAKDPHASAAYFVAADSYTVLASGYSGFPRGMDDSRVELYGGPARSMWVESAVRNAIYNRARRWLKGSYAVVTLMPCAECARALLACGVRTVYAPHPTTEELSRWAEQFEVSRQFFEAQAVAVFKLDEPSR